jgi:ribonuclease HII
LAGPVVAAAVAVSAVPSEQKIFSEITDSKILSPKKREELSEVIKRNFSWAIAEVSHETVDAINIHNASLKAMRAGVHKLLEGLPNGQGKNSLNVHVFVDGKFTLPEMSMPQEAIIDGDAKVFCIAAASIIAKVYRDALMRELSGRYPAYSFEKHKGYATLEHRKAVIAHGLSPIHRKSFCRQYIEQK